MKNTELFEKWNIVYLMVICNHVIIQASAISSACAFHLHLHLHHVAPVALVSVMMLPYIVFSYITVCVV